jgi:type I restriction enzyme, S subunit
MNQGRDLSRTKEAITDLAVKEATAKPVTPGTVLLSFKLSIGKVGIARRPMFTNEAIAALPVRDLSRLLPDYLCWALASMDLAGGANRAAMGATLNKAKLQQVRVPLPPLDEQRRIAAILDQADALRAKRGEALAHLDDLTQSIFLDMFGDQGAGWPVVRLSEVADSVTGFAFPSKDFVDSGIRLCRGANVFPGRLDWRDLKCWPAGRAAEVSSFDLAEGDVILAMDRPWIGEGFKLSMVESFDLPALLVQRVSRLRSNPQLLDQTYLYSLLRQQDFERHCRPTETTIPHISPIEVRNFEFALPPVEFQQEFASRMAAVGALKQRFRQVLMDLDDLFACLQTRAFSGEL